MNFLAVELTGSGDGAELRAEGLTIPLPPHYRDAVATTGGRAFTMGIRPEHLDVVSGGVPTATVQTMADVVEYLGNEELLHLIVAGIDMVAVVGSEHRVRPGDVLTLHVPLDKIHLFNADTEAALPRSWETAPSAPAAPAPVAAS
jgi:multiple sugar transport system ATP-binding protein